MLKNWNSKVLF